MKRTSTRPFAAAQLAILAGTALSGCHSAFIQATVENHSGGPIHVFEVDYPSASFGGSELAPGSAFRSRFKILGSGPAKLTWTDSAEHEHHVTGPQLHEGQEGTLTIAIEPTNAIWAEQLQPAR